MTLVFGANQKALRLFAVLLQSAVGLWFVASAVGKLIGIDAFEIYVFSFGWLSLSTALVLSRLLIAVELLLGLALLSGMAPRRTTLALLLLTLLFCLFLCYAEWVGRTDDCHCMGTLASLTPRLSLLKNAILILLCLALLRLPLWAWQTRWWTWTLLSVGLLIGVFAFSMPDNWMFGRSQEPFNTELFHELNTSPDSPIAESGAEKGRVVIVLAKENCRFCRHTLQKLKAIATRHHLNEDDFLILMTRSPKGSRLPHDGIPRLQGRQYDIPFATSMRLGYGAWPVVILMENGKVLSTYHYRNIDENEIAQFLSQ